MEIESLDAASRQRIDQVHRAMTQAALVQVFGKTEEEAAKAVSDLWERYSFAPERERDLLFHNDPVALACDLTGSEWRFVSMERLKQFNDSRRPSLELAYGIV